jgi:hypothetical protein
MRILRLTLAGTLTLSPRSWPTLVRLDRQWGERMRIHCAILCKCGMAMVQAALGAWWLGRRPEPERPPFRPMGRAPGIAHIRCRTTFMAFEVRPRHGA